MFKSIMSPGINVAKMPVEGEAVACEDIEGNVISIGVIEMMKYPAKIKIAKVKMKKKRHRKKNKYLQCSELVQYPIQ